MKPFIILLFLLAGCTRNHCVDFAEVPSNIAIRTDSQVEWYQGVVNDQIDCAITHLLENELTPEAAVQIAFLKNPQVQAVFEELGIAHADLIAAGLLTNPNFSLEVRYPQQRGFVTNIEYLITASFLDVFMIPLRTKVAEAQFEQAKRRVTHQILDLAFEVRETYYELLAEQQKLNCTKPIAELSSIQEEITSRQELAGNVNLLTLQQAHAKLFEADIEIALVEANITQLREKLLRLMGFCSDRCIRLPELPQEFDHTEFDLCSLESTALHQRMDLQEACFEVIRLCRMLGIKEWWTYSNLNVGLAGEREPEGVNLLGFGLNGDIPIFNYGQADRMRISAQLRQAEDRFNVLKIQVLSEVREAFKLLASYTQIIHDYKSTLLPLQDEINNSSEELYNVMGMGIDKLLNTKQQQLYANRNYFEIIKSYWITRVHLDRALGGYLFRLIPSCTEVTE
jgi:cobalt-zinc-cadmium efflux system outer membrane protein